MSALRQYDIALDDTHMRCWRGGSGPGLILLHGSGAGASTWGNFGSVVEPLTEHFEVLAADLIGFGQSGRWTSEPYFDMARWVRQAERLVEELPGEKVGFVGHSLSGAIALKLAGRTPRIGAVLTTGTMGAHYEAKPRADSGWTYPKDRDSLRTFVQAMVHDPARIGEDELDRRLAILSQPGYEAYFSSMFQHDRTWFFSTAALSDEEIAAISVPVLLVHGANDIPIPVDKSSQILAGKIPHSDLLVLGRCGHSVAIDHPEKFIRIVRAFFADLPLAS